MFGRPQLTESQRHDQFDNALRIMLDAWNGGIVLPKPAIDLHARCWLAVNSAGAAQIAGSLGFNMLFSHLRTPAQYREYSAIYRRAGATGMIAANRPVYVGDDDISARAEAEPAIRTLWRRFKAEGKIPANIDEPTSIAALCEHPLNFIVGGPQSVAMRLRSLNAEAPFDIANLEVRWPGLSHQQVCRSVQRLADQVGPKLRT